MRKLVQE